MAFDFIFGGVFAIFGFLFMLLFFAFVAIVFAFWIWMIIDCVNRRFKNETDKIVWILIIVLLHWIGALLYYIVVRIYGRGEIASSFNKSKERR